jgi:hypothetical protein
LATGMCAFSPLGSAAISKSVTADSRMHRNSLTSPRLSGAGRES